MIVTVVAIVVVVGSWGFFRPVRLKTALRSAQAGIARLEGERVDRSHSGPVTLRPPAPVPRGEAADRPDILLVLIDTLRADHLGAYGYARATSPFLDRLAREGALFSNMVSQSPWTKPSVAALMTGLYPSDLWSPAPMGDMLDARLPEGPTTLAETLWAGGYQTLALSDHPAINAPRYGRGFEVFDLLPGGPATGTGWSETPEAMVTERWGRLLARGDGRPLFAYLHLIYPHLPYEPPPPFDSLFGRGAFLIREWQRDGVLRLYDGEIRRTDELLERLVVELSRIREKRERVTVVTSDHGEGFWEHGLYEHGNSLFNELLKVPLIVQAPGRFPAGVRVDAMAQTVDLLSTLADLAHVRKPESRGRSLVDGLEGSRNDGLPVLSEFQHSGDFRARAAQDRHAKVIVGGDGSIQAFEISTDPGELSARPLSEEFSPLLQALKSVRPWPGVAAGGRGLKPAADELERLRALGYLGSRALKRP